MKVIYIRTSTTEQTPELQLRDLSKIVNIDECSILKDQQSAFKDNVEREEFRQLQKLIEKDKIKDLYVWDLDRLYRNRKKLISFFEFCKFHNCNIHSYRQQWLEDILKVPAPWNDIIYNLLIQIMGWMAEEESIKKSERIKNAVSQKKDYKGKIITVSKYGNRWGRKGISQQAIKKVLKLHEQGLSIRQIAAQVKITDKNKNQKNISKSTVHKIITEFSQKKK